jgi:hypothetical protein
MRVKLPKMLHSRAASMLSARLGMGYLGLPKVWVQ